MVIRIFSTSDFFYYYLKKYRYTRPRTSVVGGLCPTRALCLAPPLLWTLIRSVITGPHHSYCCWRVNSYIIFNLAFIICVVFFTASDFSIHFFPQTAFFLVTVYSKNDTANCIAIVQESQECLNNLRWSINIKNENTQVFFSTLPVWNISFSMMFLTSRRNGMDDMKPGDRVWWQRQRAEKK